MVRARSPVLVLLALVFPAVVFASPLKFDAPKGWWHKSDPSGASVFLHKRRKGRQSTTIKLGQLQRATGTPTDFAQQIAQSPSSEFSNPSEVQIFTSPDKRSVVAVDGTLADDGHSLGRQCWVFEHGMRVLAELLAPDESSFKDAEATFMTFVASVRITAPSASAPAQPPQPRPEVGPRAPSAPQPTPQPTVESTLTFAPPPDWSRAVVGSAVWYQAPGDPSAPTYIMVTPAEVLHSDFPTWFEHRLRPSAGMKIIERGESKASHSSSGYQLIRVRQVLSFHGVRHEQSVLAAHLGRAAVLVALDAPSVAALKAHDDDFTSFLATLDIVPSLTGVASAPAAAPPATSAPPAASPSEPTSTVASAGPGGFPGVEPPPGWTLTHSDQAWRTYAQPDAGEGGYLTMLVSQITGGADPAGSLARLRASLGIPGKRHPERVSLPSGAVLYRTVDPAVGQVPITEVVVLSDQGRQVLLMLRSSDATRFNAARPAFEAAVERVHL